MLANLRCKRREVGLGRKRSQKSHRRNQEAKGMDRQKNRTQKDSFSVKIAEYFKLGSFPYSRMNNKAMVGFLRMTRTMNRFT